MTKIRIQHDANGINIALMQKDLDSYELLDEMYHNAEPNKLEIVDDAKAHSQCDPDILNFPMSDELEIVPNINRSQKHVSWVNTAMLKIEDEGGNLKIKYHGVNVNIPDANLFAKVVMLVKAGVSRQQELAAEKNREEQIRMREEEASRRHAEFIARKEKFKADVKAEINIVKNNYLNPVVKAVASNKYMLFGGGLAVGLMGLSLVATVNALGEMMPVLKK